MIPLHIYQSNTIGDAKNCYYPNKIEVTDEESFKLAVSHDHVMALYNKNYRSSNNFLESDCLPFDCDNDHSNNSADWVTPFEVAMEFPDVAFTVSYSKNHMKDKGSLAARPRFHVYFPVGTITSEAEYVALKKQVADGFPYFDSNALDSARFLFGTSGDVEFYNGNKTIANYLDECNFANWEDSLSEISEGGRNNAMSHIAGKLIMRFGNTDESFEKFMKQAEKCNPPLESEELSAIWNSATKFGAKVSSQDGYIPPDQYNSSFALKPTDFSDVGQARVMSNEYNSTLAYSPSTDYLVYNGSFWDESKEKAQAVAQELTDRQLEESENEITKTIAEMKKNGAMELIEENGEKKAVPLFSDIQLATYRNYEQAQIYKKYAIKRRDSKYITNTLKEGRPMLLIEQSILDKDEFLLNTPSITLNLRDGTTKEHEAFDYITKQTNLDPTDEGMDIWLSALDTIFLGDQELIDYVQKIVGLSSIGKVYVEALIIAFGDGSNGKSTFWNVIARVLGMYSGTISADILTVGCKRNVKPELAEAKGKRLLIAAEMEEGVRLNTSNVKQLCSTDKISAEKKYKDPFSYVPSHTLVLYTNHLPRVGAIDNGTWRRLIVIPFGAKIKGKSDIKNYADYLFDNAGGAILKWILEGANSIIADDYKFVLPQKVKDAIDSYKENNDWLGSFLSECCELDKTYSEKSGQLYSEYRAYCLRTGEYTRSTTDFYSALELDGYEKRKTKQGIMVHGLRLKSEFAN